MCLYITRRKLSNIKGLSDLVTTFPGIQVERLYVSHRVDDIFTPLYSDKQIIYRNYIPVAGTVLRRTPTSSEVAIGAALFPVATEIATMR